MTSLQRADLTSGVGALVLGFGLGALGAHWLASTATLVTLIGLLTHAVGMWDKHRSQSGLTATDARWASVLYWTCWALLAGVAALVAWRLR